MGKVIVGLLAIFLLFGGFSTQIISGINNLRIDETTDAFVVVTGAGETTANITLTGNLFQADLGEITTLTSSNVTETPTATTYTEATQVLLLTTLDAANTRTITIVYNAETTDAVWSAIGPFLVVIVIGALLYLIFSGMFKRGRH